MHIRTNVYNSIQKFLKEFKYDVVQKTVDYCAWGHYYQKPTHVWTSMTVLLGAEWDAGRGHRQVQATMPLWGDRGQGEVGPRILDRAGEPQGDGGGGQAVEQECSPSGLAQGNLQGQEGALPSQVESAVPGWAVNHFPDGSVVGSAVESTV